MVGRLGKGTKMDHDLPVSHQLVPSKVLPSGPDSTLHEVSHIYRRKDAQDAHQLWKMMGLCSFVPFKKHILLSFSLECNPFPCGSKICNLLVLLQPELSRRSMT